MTAPDQEDAINTFVLISDEPSDLDEFAAQAHGGVAEGIARLVRSDTHGRVIGLEGSWGSGKSTIVRLLTTRLGEATAKHPVQAHSVVFDAWAHEGDPLRRTFLEALIDDLETATWLPKEAAKSYRDELSGRHATSKSRSTTRLTLEGQLAAASALLIPLGAFLLGNAFRSWHREAQVVGLAFMLAPLLVIVGFFVAKSVGILTGGRKKDSGRRHRLARLQPFSFLAKDQKVETETSSIESGDPTSVEFERVFSGVLSTALEGSRRLLIVLDNLDRVDESDARRVLATMQTFTGIRQRPGESWQTRLWTLIPYDPDGLDRLWDSTAEGESTATAQTTSSDVALPHANDTAAAFIDKVFQARFEAPPLVLSDWRGYVTQLLRRAMPEISDDEAEAVLRLRALYPGAEPKGLVAHEPPTPRHIKQFVNQVGLIHERRSGIPLGHIAYYVLLRRDKADVASALLGGRLPHPRLAHLFTPSIETDLAALHFGAEQTLAQQLLLGRALDDAFSRGDPKTVEELTRRPGFADALENLDLEPHRRDGAIELARMVAVLADADVLEEPQVVAWRRGRLEPTARQQGGWILSGRDSGRGVGVLFDALSAHDHGLLGELLGRVVADATEADPEGRLQIAGLAGLADELVRRGRLSKSTSVRLSIPGERLASSVAYYASQIEDPRSRAMLEPTLPPQDVGRAIAESASAEGGGEDVRRALDVLVSRPGRVDVEALSTDVLVWLRENDATDADQLATLLYCLDTSAEQGSITDGLGNAADEGALLNIVGYATSNGWHAQAAEASMLSLAVRPSLPDPASLRQAPSGLSYLREALADPANRPEMREQLLAWLKAHRDRAVATLLNVRDAGAANEWVDESLRDLATAGCLDVTPAQFSERWSYLKDALGDEGFTALATRLIGDEPSRNAIVGQSSDAALANDLLTRSSGAPVPALAVWSSGIVKATTQDQWERELRSASGGPTLELALRLAGGSDAPNDPSGLQEALHLHFQALSDGTEDIWEPDGDRFVALMSLFSAETREVLASQLCAELEGRAGNVGPGLFAVYGPFLSGEAEFRRHGKLPNLVERLVAREDWSAITWVADVADAHPDTFDPTERQSAMKHLARKVNEKLKEAGEEAPESLKRLAAHLSK